jgi:hypothetical protein
MKEQSKKRSAGGAQRKTSAEPVSPSLEEIAQRAYEIFLARGGETGHEMEDWLQAEKELRERYAKA